MPAPSTTSPPSVKQSSKLQRKKLLIQTPPNPVQATPNGDSNPVAVLGPTIDRLSGSVRLLPVGRPSAVALPSSRIWSPTAAPACAFVGVVGPDTIDDVSTALLAMLTPPKLAVLFRCFVCSLCGWNHFVFLVWFVWW